MDETTMAKETSQKQDSSFFGDPAANGFSTKKIRSDFVAKVYSLLCVQLTFTIALMCLAMFVPPINEHLKQHGWIYVLFAAVLLLPVTLVMVCVRSATRSYPTNYIMLSLFTLIYSIIVACTVVFYSVQAVLIAAGLTFAVCVIVYLLAAYSSLDITNCGCVLYILLISHMIGGIILGLILVPLGYFTIYNIIWSSLGALLFSLYLMYDLQLIMGGRNREVSPEDYVLAACSLYVDVIMIFLNILSIMGQN